MKKPARMRRKSKIVIGKVNEETEATTRARDRFCVVHASTMFLFVWDVVMLEVAGRKKRGEPASEGNSIGVAQCLCNVPIGNEELSHASARLLLGQIRQGLPPSRRGRPLLAQTIGIVVGVLRGLYYRHSEVIHKKHRSSRTHTCFPRR